MTSRSLHPLDVDLADLVDGVLYAERASSLDAHIAGCILCRSKVVRLHGGAPAGPVDPLPPLACTAPDVDAAADPTPGDLWVAGTDERTLVLVLRVLGHRAVVAPVTFDVEAADDETVVVDAPHSPFRTGLAVHPALSADLPRAALVGRVGALVSPAELAGLLAGPTAGPAAMGAGDPRLQVRQQLADRLAALDPDAPTHGAEPARAALVADLRALRGPDCAVRPLVVWGPLVLAEAAGWEPVAVLDEVGVVLVVFDTPHGLVDEADFDAARSVLTRRNATALVVLARGLGDLAEVFDAAALHAGIDLPSGAHAPPRPLISGLVAFDAIAKYLDQHSGARAMSPPTRGPLPRIDVGGLLAQAAAEAEADAARQGARFKIPPKRRGYESLAESPGALGDALAAAFTGGSVVDELLELGRRPAGDQR